MKTKFIGIVAAVMLLTGCAREPETGFTGNIFYGEGDCMPVNGPGFGRTYDNYKGLVYFVPYSVTQQTPFPSFETLKSEGIAVKSKRGKVRVELNPGIYLVMLENYYQFTDDKIIRVNDGELVELNMAYWKCISY